MPNKKLERIKALESKFGRADKCMSLTILEDGETYEEAEARAIRDNPYAYGHLIVIPVEPNPEFD